MSTASARFAFGKNWSSFLTIVTEQRIAHAAEKLSEFLGDIRGKTFLDVGCGSGIHSLAAVRLGAVRVVSFDYDQDSVNCTAEMKRRFAPSSNWTIERGSVLDESYIRSLGKFDVVYSWGVLHHTGDMWEALELVSLPCSDRLFIAIYDDQGWRSRVWWKIKYIYNHFGIAGRIFSITFTFLMTWVRMFFRHPLRTTKNWLGYQKSRGMSPWHDVIDWAGGYPYEVAKPDELIAFYANRGFSLKKSITKIEACNELLFESTPYISP